MRKADVKIGRKYIAKISGAETVIRLTGESIYGGWDAVNERTGRRVRVRTAAKLRREVRTTVKIYAAERLAVVREA